MGTQICSPKYFTLYIPNDSFFRYFHGKVFVSNGPEAQELKTLASNLDLALGKF